MYSKWQCQVVTHDLFVVSAVRLFGQALLLAPSRDHTAILILVHENKRQQ